MLLHDRFGRFTLVHEKRFERTDGPRPGVTPGSFVPSSGQTRNSGDAEGETGRCT
jgi:hypothetical protein